jgi:hypothetical protein
MKPMTMKAKILAALMPIDGKMPGTPVDVYTLGMVCNRYGGRLHELKADGYDWVKEWSETDHRFYYRLITLPATATAVPTAPAVTAPAQPPEHPKRRRRDLTLDMFAGTV